MNVDTIRINAHEAAIYADAMGLTEDELGGVITAVRASDPAYAFTIDLRPVAMCGFIPTAILSSTAYAWLQETPEMRKHVFMTARVWYNVFNDIRERYPRIVGHCSAGPRSVRWLKRLGAKFAVDPNGTPTYMIGDFE